MIKKIAWETFKNTGDVNTFLELQQIKNIEEQIQEQKAEQNGNYKNEWNNNFSLNTLITNSGFLSVSDNVYS